MMYFIDAHCHLNAEEFNSDVDIVINKAKRSGVQAAVVVSETRQDFKRTIELSELYPDWIYPCLGLHPVQGESKCVTREDHEQAVPLIRKYGQRLTGIGEIGLDFSPWICKSAEDKAEQEYVFRLQIKLAKDLNLPVNVHSRSAAKRALEILVEEGAEKVLLHNFAGRPSVAMTAASSGFYMSFPPHATTKPEREKLLKSVPVENLCLETDSPALGVNLKERNEPYFITETCKCIAELKGMAISDICDMAWRNSLKLFSKIKQ